MMWRVSPFRPAAFALLAACATPMLAAAQQSPAMRLGATLVTGHRVVPDVTYLVASGHEAKLDVYASRLSTPAPLLVYFHGGGWVGGSKESAVLAIMPYLAMGWTIANVEYRLARHALAPAAVEDVRCALRWLLNRAEEFNFDTARVVLTGHSAGGHLSLIAGMLPVSAGLDRQCAGTGEIRVAAIINWFGITDVADLLDGENIQSYAVQWLGSMPDREDIARRVSPITYVRAGLPPVITIHGDADPTVPWSHAVRLHEALTGAGVPNELITVAGGRHGGFSAGQDLRAYTAIEAFLTKHGVMR